LATSEVYNLLVDSNVRLADLHQNVKLDTEFVPVNDEQTDLYRNLDTGSSGGYAEFIYRFAAKSLFGIEVRDSDVQWRSKANDIKELSLIQDGKILLRFALAYGQKHLTNLTRSIGQKQCKYDFVEIMACPSGCLNGGGQLKADINSSSQEISSGSLNIRAQKQLVAELDVRYHEQRKLRLTSENPIVARVYNDWLQSGVGGDKAKQYFHTQYVAAKLVDDKQSNGGAAAAATNIHSVASDW